MYGLGKPETQDWIVFLLYYMLVLKVTHVISWLLIIAD